MNFDFFLNKINFLTVIISVFLMNLLCKFSILKCRLMNEMKVTCIDRHVPCYPRREKSNTSYPDSFFIFNYLFCLFYIDACFIYTPDFGDRDVIVFWCCYAPWNGISLKLSQNSKYVTFSGKKVDVCFWKSL